MESIFRRGARLLQKKFSPGHAPDFIIAGAQKSGTTSLHYYLSQHPRLLASTPKEVRYFDRDDNFEKGKRWYHRAFININNDKKDYLCFEATPEYIYRSFAAERIHREYPGIKIIMILREPVQRAYSSWNMYRQFPRRIEDLPGKLSSKNGYLYDRENNLVKELYKGESFPTFAEAVESEMQKIRSDSVLEEPSFLRRGIYLPQVRRFHDLFGKKQVLILGFKDLLQEREATLNKILHFLNLEPYDWSVIDDEKKNVIEYSEKMSEEMKHKLSNFYEQHNREFFDYLGCKINW